MGTTNQFFKQSHNAWLSTILQKYVLGFLNQSILVSLWLGRIEHNTTGVILGMGSANEWRRYIGWANTQNALYTEKHWQRWEIDAAVILQKSPHTFHLWTSYKDVDCYQGPLYCILHHVDVEIGWLASQLYEPNNWHLYILFRYW